MRFTLLEDLIKREGLEQQEYGVFITFATTLFKKE